MTKPYADVWSTTVGLTASHVRVFDVTPADRHVRIHVDVYEGVDVFPLKVTKTPTGFAIEANAGAAKALLLGLRDIANGMRALQSFGERDAELDGPVPETECPGDSPIEQSFARAWRALTGAYPQAQVQIGTYRVDFLVNRTVIELDGHAYHSTKEQRGHDAKRDRYLQSQGYRVVRFTGSEVHRDAAGCARQALELSK